MEASVEQGIAWQIRANRLARELSQVKLAELLGTTQSAISRLEDPEYGCHSMESLTKLANVFDCALSVKFISYAELARDSVDLSPESMVVPTFSAEVQQLTGEENVGQICE